MDLAVMLIKSVLRAFYPTRDILVVDALILHEALRDDDLAYLMAINTKDLHKICGKLREDRFLTVHTRQEMRQGNPRPSNRTWYYINYRHTIDAIKWRVYTIDKEVQGSSVPVNEKKEYFCTFCKSEWTAMEVLDNVGPDGFRCHRCHQTLTFEADRNSGGHEQSTRLNDQFKFIGELLPKIDAVHIPECDFDRALSKARPVVRDATHQRAATIPLDSGTPRPMAVKGLTNTGPQSIAINISTLEGPSEVEKEAERVRREQIARQNALPSWMSTSTVTGESFAGVSTSTTTAFKGIHETLRASPGVEYSTSAQIDDIFEKLKAEQALQGRTDQGGVDEEEAGSDDGENEFEDVPTTLDSVNFEAQSQEHIRQDAPGCVPLSLHLSEGRGAKKVRLESCYELKQSTSKGSKEDEDDEGLEFEDV